MSRSGWNDDYDGGESYPPDFYWRAIENASRGKRGQAFWRNLLAALDALPSKELIREDLEDSTGSVCTIGALARIRGIDMSRLDPDDYETPAILAKELSVAPCLVREVIYENDDVFWKDTPEARFSKMRAYVESKIIPAGA